MDSTHAELEEVQRAYAALRESEERYRAVVQQVSEAIFLLDVETMCLIEANAAFTDLLGYTYDEIPHLSLYDLLPYDAERIARTMSKVLEAGTYHVRDRLYRRKDGSFVRVEVNITLITYSGKQVLCQVLRDITERMSFEAVLAARVQQQAAVAALGQQALAGAELQDLLDAATVVVAQTLEVDFCKVLELLPDGSGLLLRAGTGWAAGLVGTAIVGTGLVSQAGYTLASGEPIIVEDLATEERFNGPPLLRAHNIVSGMSVLIRGRGMPFGVLGAHSDKYRIFTRDDIYFLQAIANVLAEAIDRDKVQRELQASRDQLEVILQGVADGITVQDPTGRLIYANSTALKLIGFSSREEFLSTPSAEILGRFELLDEHNEPLPVSRLPGRYALQGQESSELLVGWRTVATGETRWSTVKAAPVKNEHGQVQLAVSIFRDVTEQVELERRKDDFVALASHELKTPITSLKIFTQVLRKRFERALSLISQEDAEAGSAAALESIPIGDTLKQLTRMDQQLNKLTDLVRDLLDASKTSAGKLTFSMERFDIGELAGETVDDLQRIADKHSIVLVENTRRPVLADRERIRQVFTNLITNAVKYSPQADRILVGVKSDLPDSGVTCYVQDFGIGIPKSEQQEIFKRFFQVQSGEADRAARGTFPGLGLGLYISSEIVNRHGGKIWVESDWNKGSTFYFTLPGGVGSEEQETVHAE